MAFPSLPDASVQWIPQATEDGSFTFFSKAFGEAFHSTQGAKTEAIQKFAVATDLADRAASGHLRLLDICYGLGYNTAAALETIWAVNPDCEVEIYGLELDATVPRAAIASALIEQWPPNVQLALQAIARHHHYQAKALSATLLLGDARQTIQPLIAQGWQADAIFFDPFSPRRCPQLWTVEFFTHVARCLAPTGKLATYSRAAAVRAAMQAAGFVVGTMPLKGAHLPHEWALGTVAAFETAAIAPLSPMEQEHLQTRAAIPYRDPTLTDSAEVILARHQQEQQSSQRESTSSWRRRWGIH